MDVAEFLKSTITAPKGYLCLALRAPNVAWHEQWFEWPNQLDEAMALAYKCRDEYDVYFTSYLFEGKGSSAKLAALPSRTIQADLDSADIRNLPLKPGTLVKTSPGRYQAYWYLDDKTPADLELLELLSRRLTYAIPDSDKSGWSVGHKVRVADTFNHKYLDAKHLVEVVDHDPRLYSILELEMLPEVDTLTLDRFDSDFINSPPTTQAEGMGANELMVSIRSKIPITVYSTYNIVATDRSAALWALMCAAFRAGLNRNDVYYLAANSANNKFARLTFHAERELAKDVLRAENTVFTSRADPRELVMDLRHNPVLGSDEKKRAVTGFVYTHMKEEGDFIKTPTNQVWYVPRDTGKPVSVTQRSEKFDSLLDIRYGLNRTETFHEFTVFGIINQQVAQASNGRQAALSYYDPKSHALYLHSGRKDVYVITANGISTVTDGARGLVFPWDIYTPFTLADPGPPIDWAYEVFGKLDNVVHFSAQEARLLLKVWLMFLLFRDAASSRPILALFGQPGCLAQVTPLQIQRANTAYTMSIAELYKKFHGNRWRSDIQTKIQSLKNGSIEYRTIHDVVKSGVKETFSVVAGHSIVRATEDHLFMTPKGFVPLSALHVGDLVYTKSAPVYSTSTRLQDVRRKVSVKFHPQGQANVVNGVDYPRIYKYKAIYEANLNNLTLDQFLFILNHDEARSKELKYVPVGYDVHHKDENFQNDAVDNLEIELHDTHAQRHGDTAKHHFGGLTPLAVRITSIEHFGEEETYDIQMEDASAPNFLANGLVVHNSGKTTVMHRVHALIYGYSASVLGVTNPAHFDQSASTRPLLALDNVDTWEPWLPDRLAQSASVTDIDKRKLFSDTDTIRLQRQAMVALTAHAPKFTREDITDRLLLVNLTRLTDFQPESPMIEAIQAMRNKLWWSIAQDVQAVLRNPIPDTTDIHYRIADFARLGEWIAMGLGQREMFRTMMDKTITGQVSHNLQADQVLVGAMTKYADKGGTCGEFKNQQEVFSALHGCCGASDVGTFMRMYKNQVVLGRKIWTLLESLQSMVSVEYIEGNSGARLWKIGAKDGT